ncbi:MAG TPA: alpha/beta fold hydrolase [Halomicronema sp.]
MVFPTVILPGFFAGASEYREMEDFLIGLGFPTVTVPLNRSDWWPTVGGRSLVPILRKIDATVKGVLQDFGSDKVNLVGHSAGGWIGRIYMGEKPYVIHGDVLVDAGLWGAFSCVASLVTLGTPHFSKYERWTRKNLDFVNDSYPGAFYGDVRYVCVAGKGLFGARRPGSFLAYNSYALTGGFGNCWGDGITPIEAAHLEGAENLILDGVLHSPRRVGLWYGSPSVIPFWAKFLL